MTYEYDYENVGLDEKQKHLLELGIANVDDLNIKVKEAINKRSKDGWEPLYPFSIPMIWFRRGTYKDTSLKVPNKKKKA